MKKSEIINYLNIVTCYLLIFLFTYTGVSKLIDHEVFEAAILRSPIIRLQATIISWLIPMIELLLAVMLLLQQYRKTGLLLSLFLIVIFTAYIGYMILFIPNLPCSCGGVLKELSWSNHLLFNSFFILIILISLSPVINHKLFIAINRTSRKPV
jgi:cytochrome bd-type quinol oxidase subunit 2